MTSRPRRSWLRVVAATDRMRGPRLLAAFCPSCRAWVAAAAWSWTTGRCHTCPTTPSSPTCSVGAPLGITATPTTIHKGVFR
jgi:hypothetical protein